jgi:hypothetical protein
MGQLTLGEQAAPSTPASGVTVYTTVATPSILRVINDSGTDSANVGTALANSFTTGQTIAPTVVGTVPLIVNSPASAAANAIQFQQNSVLYAAISPPAWDASTFFIEARDMGTSAGPAVQIRRNNSAGTPAAGRLIMQSNAGTSYHVWVDATGDLRIGTTAPSNANDTSGAVVGDQTSMAEAKYISDELSSLADVLERVRGGAEAVRRFVYRSGSYNRQEFEGVVTDAAPHYGMDRDADHPQGRALNEIQILGDLLRTVDWLVKRVAELEAK